MSKCAISVELDEPDRQYSPGDQVTGTVEVYAVEDCRCDELTISQNWNTHGRGNRAIGAAVEQVVFSGEWKGDRDYEYPFEFTVPNGPYSYHGHYLNVDWYIHAQADIPWAIDPKAKADFLVVQGPDGDPSTYISTDGTRMGLERKQMHSSTMGAGRAVIIIAPFPAMGLAIAWAAFTGRLDTDSPIVAMVVGSVFGIVGLGVLFLLLSNWIASRKLGNVSVQVTPEAAQPGEEVAVSVELDASARDRLNSVRATLTGRERVVSGSGTNSTTHTHDFLAKSVDMDLDDQTSADRLGFTASFRLPDDAPLSLYADDNELRWMVGVHVDVARWPDWTQDAHFDVVPAVRSASADQQPEAHAEPALDDGAVW